MKGDLIEKISKYLAQQPVLRAYLFGSHAKGEALESSDVDILVELDYTKRIGLQFIQMRLDLEQILGKKVDLVSANGLSKYIKPHIENEKLLIYARQNR